MPTATSTAIPTRSRRTLLVTAGVAAGVTAGVAAGFAGRSRRAGLSGEAPAAARPALAWRAWMRLGTAIVARRPSASGVDPLALRRWEAAGALMARALVLVRSTITGAPTGSTPGSTLEGSAGGGDGLDRHRRHRPGRLGRLGALPGREPRVLPGVRGGGLPRRAGRQGYARSVDAGMDAGLDAAGGPGSGAGADPVHGAGVGSAAGSSTTATATDTVIETVVAIDLEAIEADLADVEIALARLEAGTYWTCEVSGQPLPADLMEREPTRRRLPAV